MGSLSSRWDGRSRQEQGYESGMRMRGLSIREMQGLGMRGHLSGSVLPSLPGTTPPASTGHVSIQWKQQGKPPGERFPRLLFLQMGEKESRSAWSHFLPLQVRSSHKAHSSRLHKGKLALVFQHHGDGCGTGASAQVPCCGGGREGEGEEPQLHGSPVRWSWATSSP